MTIRRVLHPTDFSPSAHTALATAVHVADLFEAELLVTHAVVGRINETTRERLNRQLREETSAWTDAAERPVRYSLIEQQSPASGVAAVAEEQDVDLIVLGRRGRSPIRRLLLGSVALGVLHRAHCDVLIVPDFDGGEAGSVLVPLDLRDRAVHATRVAGMLARRLGAGVELLHVIDLPERMQLPTERFENVEEEMLADVASARLEEIFAASGLDVPSTVYVDSGHPAGRILRFVEDHAVRMLVASSSGMTPDERIRNYPQEGEKYDELRWLISRVTERLATYAQVPVWVIKQFPDEARRPVSVPPVHDPGIMEI